MLVSRGYVVERQDVETATGVYMFRNDDHVQQHLPQVRGSRFLYRQSLVDDSIQRYIHFRYLGSTNFVPRDTLLRNHCW